MRPETTREVQRPSCFSARLRSSYDGDSVRNIVNRLTAGGANGVQIEQSIEARNGFWKVIADAVASVYSEHVCRAS